MTILSTDLRSLKRRGYNGNELPTSSFVLITMFFLPVERILRQQEEARFAVEAERLQKEKALADQVAAMPVFPPTTEPEKSTTGSGASPQIPTSAAGTLSGIFNRHLNLQSLKRRTGLVPNEHGRPHPEKEKQPVNVAPGISPPRPQSPPMKPLPEQLPKDEYVLNQQYLSEGEQPQPHPPVRDDDNDDMPGGFPATGHIVTKGTSPQPTTPLSNICECPCCHITFILNCS